MNDKKIHKRTQSGFTASSNPNMKLKNEVNSSKNQINTNVNNANSKEPLKKPISTKISLLNDKSQDNLSKFSSSKMVSNKPLPISTKNTIAIPTNNINNNNVNNGFKSPPVQGNNSSSSKATSVSSKKTLVKNSNSKKSLELVHIHNDKHLNNAYNANNNPLKNSQGHSSTNNSSKHNPNQFLKSKEIPKSTNNNNINNNNTNNNNQLPKHSSEKVSRPEKVHIDLKKHKLPHSDEELTPASKEKIMLIQATLLELLLTNKNQDLVLKKVEEVYNNIVNLVNNINDSEQLGKQPSSRKNVLDEEEEKNLSIINREMGKKNLISESDKSRDNSIEKIVSNYEKTPEREEKQKNFSKHNKNSYSVQYEMLGLQKHNSKDVFKMDFQINSLQKEINDLKNSNKVQEAKIKDSCKNLANSFAASFDRNNNKSHKSPPKSNPIVNKKCNKYHKKSASVDLQIDFENNLHNNVINNNLGERDNKENNQNYINNNNNNQNSNSNNFNNNSNNNNYIGSKYMSNNVLINHNDNIVQELMRIDESVNSYINVESNYTIIFI